MDQFTKEGRKLRPRKTSTEAHSANFEKVEYNTERTPRENGDGYDRERNYSSRPYRSQYSDRNDRSSGGYGRGYNNNRGDYYSSSNRQYRSREDGDGYDRRRGNGGYGEYNRQRRYSRQDDNQRPYRSYNNDRPRYSSYDRDNSNDGNRYNRPSYRFREEGGNYEERHNNPYYGGNGGYNDNRNRPRRNQNTAPKTSAARPSSTKKGKKAKKNPVPHFNQNTELGIRRMIAERPIVNEKETTERFEAPSRDVVRLNKFIANSGVCSRREADTLIQAGTVTVNGEVVTELGTKINVQQDDVRFNGERLKGEEKVYIIMNKPKGFVTTASDPHADKTVVDLIKGCSARVYPVGRLDKGTTGILMLTNDGEIAERLTHPSYDKKKIYQVALDKPLSDEAYQKILSGVTLSDGEEKADALEYIDPNDKRKLGIEIHSGKNRVVRRLFEAVGYNVKALDRVYFAGLTKKGLKKGGWRYLTEGEINILKMGAYV